jgi:hypothetical protein
VKHKSALTLSNEIPKEKNIRLKMQTHMLSLDEGIGNLNLDKEMR